MLDEIFALDKRLAIANHRLRSAFPEYPALHNFIDSYLRAYAGHHRLTTTGVIALYNDFARCYARHLEKFQESGLYPCEYGDTTDIAKHSYDIALILSCVTNPARFEILHNLAAAIRKAGATKTCVIGIGAGLELALLKQLAPHTPVRAYDLALGDFVKAQFATFTLAQENFLDIDTTDGFDNIFAIEVLEHVPHYEQLLHKAWQCLKQNGQLLCTTATNMPQFDHVYNFTDIELFKQTVQRIGFTIVEHRQFHQPHSFHGIDARNDWFVLKK